VTAFIDQHRGRFGVEQTVPTTDLRRGWRGDTALDERADTRRLVVLVGAKLATANPTP
jgi:hypothetical protein